MPEYQGVCKHDAGNRETLVRAKEATAAPTAAAEAAAAAAASATAAAAAAAFLCVHT